MLKSMNDIGNIIINDSDDMLSAKGFSRLILKEMFKALEKFSDERYPV